MVEALKGNRVCQVGIVVKDIAKSAQAYADVFGVAVPEVHLTDTVDKTHNRYHGELTQARAKLAFFDMGQVSIELIEPVDGPSTWREFLDAHGEGVHHIAFQIKGTEEAVAALGAKGMPVAQQGDYTGGRYTYIDSQPALSVVLELLESTG